MPSCPPLTASLSDQAHDQVLALLSLPEFPRDTRLPSENAMAETFGVLRSVLRSGLRPVLRQPSSRLRSEGRIHARSHFSEVKKEHAAIGKAIASGNAEAARQAMTAHLRGCIGRLSGH